MDKFIMTLERNKQVIHNDVKGIIGKLKLDGMNWFSIENYDKRFKAGIYKVKYRNYGSTFEKYTSDISKYPDVVRIHRGRGVLEIIVPDRTAILFHIANFPEELEGCIAVGKENKNTWIGKSTKAYCELYETIALLLDNKTDVYINIKEDEIKNE